MINRRIDSHKAHKRRRTQARAARPAKAFPWEESQRIRATVLVAAFMLAFVALLARAVDLTVIKHDELVNLANQMHGTQIKLTKPRGEILDRNGEPLAVRINAETVFAEPRRIKDPAAAAKLLAPVLSLDEAKLREKLTGQRAFVFVKRKISAAESAALKNLALPEGVGRVNESKRHYPQGRLAAATIGFTNIETKGQEGLELTYENVLAGQSGQMVGLRDAKGRVFFPDGVNVVGFKPGGTLRLTLDAKIQWFAEDALDGVVERLRPKAAWAIVMDVQTGEILAIANRPTFDPSAPGDVPADYRRNRAITDMYEPGSTFKPLTMVMALEEGKVDLNEHIFCENGLYHYMGSVIHDSRPHGSLTPAEIIQVSSNIGAAKLAQRIGKEKMYNWLVQFGFGKRTGIDLPGEAVGQLRHYKNWWPITTCTHAYGHGINVTTIQLLTAMCALGNGGRLMKPYVVAETIDGNGQVIERNNPDIQRRVVSLQVSDKVMAMMRLVTQPGGTATQAALKDFSVAGKTGTAYKVLEGIKTYHPDKRVSSFIGLVPGDHPRLGIIVVVDEPANKAPGGLAGAPAFKQIAERSLRHLNIYPDKTDEEDELKREIDRRLLVRNEAPEPAATTPRPLTAQGLTPNFIGLTMRRALALASQNDIELMLDGSGVAIKQLPAPGQALPTNKSVQVEFAPPS